MRLVTPPVRPRCRVGSQVRVLCVGLPGVGEPEDPSGTSSSTVTPSVRDRLGSTSGPPRRHDTHRGPVEGSVMKPDTELSRPDTSVCRQELSREARSLRSDTRDVSGEGRPGGRVAGSQTPRGAAGGVKVWGEEPGSFGPP